MTTGDSFLQAILENPDDDAPRLVYADWLEERGDPRGEFIQVQCALARMDRYDEGRPELAARERALLAKHRRTWERPLKKMRCTSAAEALYGSSVGDGPMRLVYPDFSYARGFIAHLAVTAAVFLKHAPAILHAAPGRPIDLEIGTVDPAVLAASPHLAQLTELKLRAGPQALQTLLASPHLARLTALDLGGLELGDSAVESLAASLRLPRLTMLDLSSNDITARGARALAASPRLARLTTLGLHANRLGNTGAVALASANHLTRLTALHLGGNSIRLAGIRALAASPHLTRLTTLSLDDNEISDGAVRALMGTSHRTRLAWLSLGGPLCQCGGVFFAGPHRDQERTAIGAGGAQALAASRHLARVRVLALRYNTIGDAGLAALAASPHSAGLEELILPGNDIGDAGVQALAASPHLGKLASLCLCGNPLGDAGAAALAASPLLGGLRELCLLDTDIGSAGIQALAASPPLSRLQKLFINPRSTVRERLEQEIRAERKRRSKAEVDKLVDARLAGLAKILRDRFGKRFSTSQSDPENNTFM